MFARLFAAEGRNWLTEMNCATTYVRRRWIAIRAPYSRAKAPTYASLPPRSQLSVSSCRPDEGTSLLSIVACHMTRVTALISVCYSAYNRVRASKVYQLKGRCTAEIVSPSSSIHLSRNLSAADQFTSCQPIYSLSTLFTFPPSRQRSNKLSIKGSPQIRNGMILSAFRL
jgi:hypothetical protein